MNSIQMNWATTVLTVQIVYNFVEDRGLYSAISKRDLSWHSFEISITFYDEATRDK